MRTALDTAGRRRRRRTPGTPRRGLRVAAVAAGLTVCGGTVVAAASGASAQNTPSGNVAVVGYSVVGPAYQVLEADFQKTAEGKNVTFTNSFGASGSQSKAVAAGLPADIVNFADAVDMERLVSKGVVSSKWNSNQTTHGMVTDSIVVFAVPKGNPDHITTWPSLIKKGTRVFTPNPFSSGSAQWNIMSAIGAEKQIGGGAAAQHNFVADILKHTVTQDASAALELNDFLTDEPTHKNDVLLDYEDDVFYAINFDNADISYVVPPQSILIQNPVAVTKNSKNPVAANAFLAYLLSDAGQKVWASLGFRPVRPDIIKHLRADLPVPKHGTFTIQSLGGWDQVENNYFGVPNGIVTKIEASLGQST